MHVTLLAVPGCPHLLVLEERLGEALGGLPGVTVSRQARVVDLTGQLGLAQSTISKHLACLRDCRLVDVRPAGRASVYSLAKPARPALHALLAAAEILLAATGNAVALSPAYGHRR
jgi:DNA-binding transcriptional ArsR family regulator